MTWLDALPEKAGTLVRTRVSFYWHYGVFVSEEEVIAFGLPDNRGIPPEEIRVLSTDLETFSAGGAVQIGACEGTERLKARSRTEVVRAARTAMGRSGYNILHNNCEHFAMQCLFGSSDSEFINSVRSQIRAKLGRESQNA